MAESDSTLICFCNRVEKATVLRAIQQGADTLAKIYDASSAGTGPCGGSCRGSLLKMLAEVPSSLPPAAQKTKTEVVEELPKEVIEAISLFNRRYYWETHEVLEKLWLDEQGPRRKFYQGLIQASAALYHVLNANPKGVIKLAVEAQNKLSDYRPAYLGIPLDELCQRLELYAEQARTILGREQAGFDYDRLPYLLIGHDMDIPAALRSP